jgi:hypothetical protein
MFFASRLEVSLLVQKVLYLLLVFIILVSKLSDLLIMTSSWIFDFSIEPGLHLSLLKKHFLSNFI